MKTCLYLEASQDNHSKLGARNPICGPEINSNIVLLRGPNIVKEPQHLAYNLLRQCGRRALGVEEKTMAFAAIQFRSVSLPQKEDEMSFSA